MQRMKNKKKKTDEGSTEGSLGVFITDSSLGKGTCNEKAFHVLARSASVPSSSLSSMPSTCPGGQGRAVPSHPSAGPWITCKRLSNLFISLVCLFLVERDNKETRRTTI